jgi:hypothetical protein
MKLELTNEESRAMYRMLGFSCDADEGKIGMSGDESKLLTNIFNKLDKELSYKEKEKALRKKSKQD